VRRGAEKEALLRSRFGHDCGPIAVKGSSTVAAHKVSRIQCGRAKPQPSGGGF